MPYLIIFAKMDIGPHIAIEDERGAATHIPLKSPLFPP